MAPERVIYEFGDFRLDAAQRLLLLKSGAHMLPLTSRAFDTLLYLVQHPGQLLNKATLLKAIWPHVVVEENSLNQNISLLRRVLGERPGEYRYIVTVPGRGYRFVAEVRAVDQSTESASRVLPADGQMRISIAILPFANLTGDPARGYLGEAMAEELINTSARVRWLDVASRTSTFAFKDRQLDVRQIARELEVDAVLEGSIRRAGDRIRVTAQFVDGRTGRHLWSESYDCSGEDLSGMQDELTVAIVDAIVGHFTMGSTRRMAPTRHLDAYHLYLQAMALRAQPTEGNLDAAIQLLERAVTRDPEFARAWYAVAETRAYRVINDGCSSKLLHEAERDARHALELDPSVSRAHGVLGLIDACYGRWVDAEGRLRKALAMTANNPDTLAFHAVYIARQVGHERQALTEIEHAYALAPASPALALQLGTQRLLNGESADVDKWIDIAVANGYPTSLAAVHEARARIATNQGHFSEAARQLAETLSPASREAGGFDAVQAFYRAQSDRSRCERAIMALQAWQENLRPQDLDLPTAQRLMVWFTTLGAVEAAYEVAQRALDHMTPSGVIGGGWGILWLEEMRPFRDSSHFQPLLARLGLFGYWRQYGPPDNCVLRGELLRCF
ncbi:winged helix-turn-helix domain-containing protein [Steroidobacter sp. S1-65]|uniref:Winged helix-turn-helix domain-containing protein n=1 Tax=Steroidobacter gossypii TaxID=2805490 RepID=A0ABS1X0P0_9GAMM|nr:winged helix-turn-helix domain-containing protein [Steroidobacter gossypii]MBM0106809.1 winged helix-turn-helix domain-containing protein [Steroidobacter gossypii]